jgi:hypothetical protein
MKIDWKLVFWNWLWIIGAAALFFMLVVMIGGVAIFLASIHSTLPMLVCLLGITVLGAIGMSLP